MNSTFDPHQLLHLPLAVGMAWLVLPTFAVFLWRIHVEEGALTAALGDAHTNYKARTRRLIPFVY
jgi:protein-S-isoprenylcysteine O-methyltransferase Ste14